jgi:dihydrodipicolinate reductase
VSGHTLEIDLPGESVTVHHEVDDLSSAAQGAVELAGWLLDQDAGLHDAHTAIDLALRRARP